MGAYGPGAGGVISFRKDRPLPYQLNGDVARHDFIRSRWTETQYIETLRKRGEIIEIGNVLVDAANLVRRRFLCDTRLCLRVEQREGRPHYFGSCCTDLLVEITPPEQERLVPLAQAYLKKVSNGPKALVALARTIVDRDFVTHTSKNEPVLADHPTNRCILSFIPGPGRLWCGVNGMAYALKRPVRDHKPDACFAYPLHYVDFAPDRWLLTTVGRKNYRMLGAWKEAALMPCLESPRADAPPAYVFLRREIEHLWGADFWQELDRQARPMLSE
jgi:hypothetical protein